VRAYVIYEGEILDPQRYKDYKEAVAPNIASAGGRYIVRGGNPEVLEGQPPTRRTVILEFPSRQAALDWYHSDSYQEIRTLREDSARATIYVVDEVE
jgi:uncharacterized protein (DUF1330 family)